MPFDGTPTPKIEARLRLIAALEQEQVEGFTWDFADWLSQRGCGTVGCACGLAQHIGVVDDLRGTAARDDVNCSTVVARAIGINARTAAGIFNPSNVRRAYGVEYHEDVTPAMVAAKLRQLKL